jgi:thymidylate synthase
VVSELLWFISGSGNINDLKEIYRGNGIWDANYEDFLARGGDPAHAGDMGRIYGVQWRGWAAGERTIDQLQQAIDTLVRDPDSRRIIVNAWNPAECDPADVALPPCHAFFQFYVAAGRLSLQMYQRSADMFLGVPFNIASYALLLHMVARLTDLQPGEFIHTMGDAHIYLDSVEQCREQLSRKPLPLPRLEIVARGQQTIDDFALGDFNLLDYRCHAPIKARMAV